MITMKGTLQYDPARGVVYFTDETNGQCTLRIEGVRGVPKDAQIDIHLFEPGGAHHHEHCGNRDRVFRSLGPDPGVFCAEKLTGKLIQGL